MSIFHPTRRFDPAHPEFTDRADSDPLQLREEMQLLELLNRQSGGHRQPLRCLEKLLGTARPMPLRILDLGTGGADVPRTVVGWARARKLAIEITAVDRNPVILQCAREWCADWPEIHLEEGDLSQLCYPPQSFDVVMSSLVLHHFTMEGAISVLGRIREWARLGYVVNDLRRNWAAVKLVDWCASRYIHDAVTLHDARASAWAAFTVGELHMMARRAGMTDFQIHRHHGVFRMALVGRK